MKTEIIKEGKISKKIDWSKPMVVKSKMSNLFILTDGEHYEDGFSGIVIHSDTSPAVGYKSITWSKNSFSTIKEPVAITFYPNED